MKRSGLCAITGIVCLAGCATYLPGTNATVNVDAITFAILTELYCAAKDIPSGDFPGGDKEPYFGSNDKWIALIDMTLSASIQGAANPALSLLGPFNFPKGVPVGGSAGTFTTAIGGSFDETRTKLQEHKLYISMRQLVNGTRETLEKGVKRSPREEPNWEDFARKNGWPVDCNAPNAGGTYLQGQLGLKEWLTSAALIQNATVRFAPLNAPPEQTAAAPKITNIYPSTGLTTGGQLVTITGENLVVDPDEDEVWFGKLKATILRKTDEKNPSKPPSILVVRTPAVSGAGTVDVVVKTKGGYAEGKFTFTNPPNAPLADNPLSPSDARPTLDHRFPPVGPTSGPAAQSPVVSGTFTFIIKSSASIGPAFTLSRVSGGSSSLFTMTRTDNNFVNIVMSATTYCPLSDSLPAPETCAKKQKGKPTPVSAADHKNLIDQLENTNLGLKLNRIAPQ